MAEAQSDGAGTAHCDGFVPFQWFAYKSALRRFRKSLQDRLTAASAIQRID
jgi:hypothetical protein